MTSPGLPPLGGATFVSREYADKAVKLWADFGIVSEVVADGRYFRVIIYRREEPPSAPRQNARLCAPR
jgi:hypothetical protein